MEPVEPVLKNIYESNTQRKDFSWPHSDDEPRVQKKQQVKDKHERRRKNTQEQQDKIKLNELEPSQ